MKARKRVGDHLTAKWTGESAVSLRPESRTIFSRTDPDALLRFSVTPPGRVTGLSVMREGRRVVGLKVE